MTETRETGQCECGRAVVLIANSRFPTPRADGKRYVYPDKPDTGYCVFRCESCGRVIDESYGPRRRRRFDVDWLDLFMGAGLITCMLLVLAGLAVLFTQILGACTQ